MTISVKTHRDDLVEGNETFKIKVVSVDVPNVWWYSTALFYWTVTGLPTITITDAPPAPAPAPPINWGRLAACYWSSC